MPRVLTDAVTASGGTIHNLSQSRRADLLGLAAGLRRAAAGMDLVVLHVDTRDTVPMLAFAAAQERPPIAYLGVIARTAELLSFEAVLTPTGTWCEDAWITTVALTQVRFGDYLSHDERYRQPRFAQVFERMLSDPAGL